MKDLNDSNRLDSRNLVVTNMPEPKECHWVRRDDLILRSRGVTNTVALVDQEVWRTIVAAPLLRIRVSRDSILPEYLCWYINLPDSQAFLHSQATGTAMRTIGKHILSALKVQVPSLETQQHIIAVNQLADTELLLLACLAEKRSQWTQALLVQAISVSHSSAFLQEQLQ